MRYKFMQGANAEKHSQPTGESTTFLATGADTDGRVSIFDSHLKKGNGAPWHFHETDDEIFYVIAGEVEFGIDKDTVVAKPGDLVIAGPNVHRRFRALGAYPNFCVRGMMMTERSQYAKHQESGPRGRSNHAQARTA